MLVEGVTYLDPEPAVFEAMVAGWQDAGCCAVFRGWRRRCPRPF